ncbi:PhoH family protein [Orrella sp. 11846]|uniref:PhoH family protein n=1 Tax=Orrella sp. 11846 TaxID=3409913 RepID=UPI003B5C403D
MPLPKMPSKPATLLDIDALPKLAKTAKKPSQKTAAKKAIKTADMSTETVVASKPAIKTAAKKAVKTATKTATKTTTKAASKTTSKTSAKKTKKVVDTQTTGPDSITSTPITPANTPAVIATKPRVVHPTERREGQPALFVLDTNVLLHDPSSLFRFEEHDIYLPMTTLEELDQQKKGMSEVARNARQVSRWLNDLVSEVNQPDDFERGVPLDTLGHGNASGRMFFQTKGLSQTLPADFPMAKADNQILAVVQALTQADPQRAVVLVSKDINMRLKAKTLCLNAEDYYNDHVLEDTDLLYTGVQAFEEDFWSQQISDVESWQQDGMTFYRIHGPLCAQLHVNQFLHIKTAVPLFVQVREIAGQTAVLATLRDYSHAKNHVWGIMARNQEQNFALNLLMDPDCDFVTLLGQAGTGKTLLALAAGLTQVLETQRYSEIIMTRVTVPVAEDIGFLPGTEEEKMQPWMGALEDNLEVLNARPDNQEPTWGQNAAMEVIQSKIKVKSLNFMRGRTFLKKFLILDEAQNLTPKQMKTLITRAGPGTKVVCLGNIAQIDTPYLTESSSGLTYVVDRFKDWPHAGHVTLQRGERSRLADYAADIL